MADTFYCDHWDCLGVCDPDESDHYVQDLARGYMLQDLNKMMTMFEYPEGMPDTITPYVIERNLQTRGYSIFVEHEGNHYFLWGGWGGEPDYNYIPTEVIIANPYLPLNKTYKIGEDCVLVKNDPYCLGTLPLIKKWSWMLSEADVSIRSALINSRIISLLVARDDATRRAAQEYIDLIKQGKTSVILSDEGFYQDALKAVPFQTSGASNLEKAALEARQYINAARANDLGIQLNWNSKREATNEAEAGMNEQYLLTLPQLMLMCRQEGFKQVKEMFGIDCIPKLRDGTPWALNVAESEAEQETAEEGPEEKKEEGGSDDETKGTPEADT